MSIDLYDEIGIGGGASGVAGGLLHPYSPKGLCFLKTYRTPVLFLKAYLVSPFFKKLLYYSDKFFPFCSKASLAGCSMLEREFKVITRC